MENSFVIGILDIVEDKLREFGIQLPDDCREDSTDPIVGYHYAELHDRIQEYLEEQSINPDNHQFIDSKMTDKPKIYVLSVVNPENSWDGTESSVSVFSSLRDCIDSSYDRYSIIWDELTANGDINEKDYNGQSFMTKEEFESQFKKGHVCIQLSDYHIQFEFFEKELEFPKDMTVSNEKSMSELLSKSAIPTEDSVWICVYKDVLGYPDDLDNLTNILVPADWLLNELKSDGLLPEEWFNEYTADNTDELCRKALSLGIILDCSDDVIKNDLLKNNNSLDNIIRDARSRSVSHPGLRDSNSKAPDR